ncbi:hypothetical protein NKW85_10920 [Staphylococcus simulans]|uniref:Uncharacterized protein n=1 Tax=Staphylococcus simulans UMC-CNS-990 TaxID=1405498 RepID=A0ABN0PDP7_STASI|nr:hypothetical protein [Staphylococcus simulans]ERS93740.1 hypothetical protein SSIM_05960 [Staphylococcus simulans UMC-CNS-990]MCE5148772.1 hypothetical protein [Staphylococcus simulans]PTJ33468.1 hypothetical protein BU026_05160 [Staphylococcus simulans]
MSRYKKGVNIKKKKHKGNKNIHVADAIVGGVFGATFGWFYRREGTQNMIHRVKESELFQNIASDVYEITEENIKAYIAMNIENKTRDFFQKPDEEDEEYYEDDEEFEEAYVEDEDDAYDDEDEEELDEEEYYEALLEENEQLKEAISRLEDRFEELL